MRGLLVGLFPRWWRRRHGASYRDLLDRTPLSPGVIRSVLGAAARAWGDPRHSRLTALSAGALTASTLVLLFCFIGGWSSLYQQSGSPLDWRTVQFAALGYAVVGAVLVARSHRVVGVGTIALAAAALVWQQSVGVPGWRSGMGPLQGCAMWFLALSCWCAWWSAYGVHDPRRATHPAG